MTGDVTARTSLAIRGREYSFEEYYFLQKEYSFEEYSFEKSSF